MRGGKIGVQVYLTPDAKNALLALAEDDHRSASSEAEWLIRAEKSRREGR